MGLASFSLFEVMIAIAIVSVGLPAVAYMYTTSLQLGSSTQNGAIAQFLANSLMNEISQRRFRESVAEPGNSPQSAQISGFDRTGFTDVGDYNIFKLTWGAISPPRDEVGAQLTQFAGFSQFVEVYNIPAPGMGPIPRSFNPVSDGSTDFKVVTVTIKWNKGKEQVRLSKLFVLP